MRSFNYKYSVSGSILGATNYGTCFGISKSAKTFEYMFTNEMFVPFQSLTKQETISAVVKIVQDFIKEIGWQVEFEYRVDSKGVQSFYFQSTTDEYIRYYSVYSCVIFSRWFLFGDKGYSLCAENVYNLTKKGYTPFEAYIITGIYANNPSYNFSSSNGIHSIDVYRGLKDKKKVFLKSEGINYNVSKCIKFYPIKMPVVTEDIEKWYFQHIKIVVKPISKLYKLEFHNHWSYETPLFFKTTKYINELLKIKNNENSFKLLMAGLTSVVWINGKNYTGANIGLSNLQEISCEEVVREEAQELKKYLNKAETMLLKKPFIKMLHGIFGEELVNEINKQNITKTKLKQWKVSK